jgi:hypothetical protein
MIPRYLHKVDSMEHKVSSTKHDYTYVCCPLFFVRDLVHQVGPETRRN